MHGTAIAAQASGILIFRVAFGAAFSWVTTV
ncbi:hypothetical protein B0H03_11376 [Rathayibacter iranicus NCPPB 2253 = VKM Ac-1602]|uniref:Uncharacterized protein n=1 Tax=Rathayibacter iranicus NCPPB 2253 = VKM Ac-1602 TaxID=1328868 RepID=A0ABX5L9V1_9MICO|nr:hypothetical protein B0H03_11376 [Rathayibacter iranicus NCPPB 2253 = VKM Ac-1602]